jgi:hypothetical protein
MRPKEDEDKGIKEVKVELAGNHTAELRMNDADTVLGERKTRVIVPLVPIVKQLGCRIRTTRTRMIQIIHPKRGVLPVDDSSGTPTMPKKECQMLIKELEEYRGKKNQEEQEKR